MMRYFRDLALPILILGLATASSWGGETRSDLPLTEVPEEIKAATLRAVPGIWLVDAAIEPEKGDLLYELRGMVDGKRCAVELTENGKIVSIQLGNEQDVPLSRVPIRARRAAQDALPEARLVGAGVSRNKKGPVYVIEATMEGQEYEILVTLDGRVTQVQQTTTAQDVAAGANDD